MTKTRTDVAMGTLLFAAIFAAYWPALHGGLLWDDAKHITAVDLRPWHGLWRIWFDLGATQQYYPLLHTAFWTEHRLWGDAVLGYHLTNVILHGVAACLVAAIVGRLGLPGRWLAAFVFALHPVTVEAVAWISEQKSTLSAVFYLASALTYLRFDQKRRQSLYWLALGLFLLALMTKTVTATLPAALLVMLWWQRGSLEWRRDVRPLLAWFVPAIAAGLVTAAVERNFIGARGPDFALTPAARCLVAGRAIWFYLGKLLWPAGLTFTYPRWNVDPSAWWQWLFPAGVLALAASLWLLRRRSRGPLAGFLFFAGTLFPALGFLNVYPFIYSYVADHFQYLASLGVIVPVAVAATRARAAAYILPLTLGVLTFQQTGMYRDSETLYTETVARNPAAWMAHNNLGNLLSNVPGRRSEAIAHYRAALAAKPDLVEAHVNLAATLMDVPGDLPQAMAEDRAALAIKSDDAAAHHNLGRVLAAMRRLPEAITEYRAAVALSPESAVFHNNLGNALAGAGGQLPEAITEYQTALRLNPQYADAHNNLGLALSKFVGRRQDAIAEFETALRLKPDYIDAHYSLGALLVQDPARRAEGLQHLEAVLHARPNAELARIVERIRASLQ